MDSPCGGRCRRSAALPSFAGNADPPSHRMQAACTTAQTGTAAADYNAYFGDIHNPNAVGYARGGLRRAFEIARNQRISETRAEGALCIMKD